jgi:hypothetical protein
MSEQSLSNVEAEIKQLEREKLAEEIRQLKASGKRQWITPAALTGLIPILAGLGIWLANEMKQYNEGFQALGQRDALQVEKAELQTEKDSLNQEIETLLALKNDYVEQARELRARVVERQKQLDESYLRARFASEEARYALSHVEGMGPRLERGDLDRLKAGLGDSSAGTAAELGRVFELYALSSDMIEVTQETLGAFSKALDQVPVSEWARELQPMPSGWLNGRDVMVAQKGDGSEPRYYDIDEGRFLTAEESRPP